MADNERDDAAERDEVERDGAESRLTEGRRGRAPEVRASETDGERMAKSERRAAVASAFTGFLIGLAITEAVGPVRDIVHKQGVTFDNLCLFAVFFFTCTRFFIGGTLHLLNKELLSRHGVIWFVDFMVISIESTILVFMAGVTNLEVSENPETKYGFIAFFMLLMALDTIWIAYQAVFYVFWVRRWEKRGEWRKSWIRIVPWEWGLLTVCLVALMLMPYFGVGVYAHKGLVWMFAVNAAAFVIDVLLIDRAKLI